MAQQESRAPFWLSLWGGLVLVSSRNLLGNRMIFVLLTGLLCLYLLLEVLRLRRLQPQRWLLNPTVLASFLTFFLSFGISNALFFLSEDTLSLIGLVPGVSGEMVKLMWLVWIGAMAMWLGYWSPVAEALTDARSCRWVYAHYLDKVATLRPWSLHLLIAVSLLARLIQIRLGVFCYGSDYDHLIEMGSITQYLGYGAYLGKLALLIVAFRFFSDSESSHARRWFFGLLAYEVVFGLMSGFKSQVVMPFVIVGVCQYLRAGRIRLYWLLFFVAAVLASYALIEPFRVATNKDADFQGTSSLGIAKSLIGAASSGGEPLISEEKANLAVSMLSRSSMVYVGSLGIAYADQNPLPAAGSPHFLGDILMAPIHAWVPRFLWASKPLGNLGLWYTQVVMGRDYFSSTAMGPFTYLYFAGGVLAVFSGFFALGIVQRMLFFLTLPASSAAGGVIFLGMFSTVANIDSAINSIVISLFRELPLMLLLMTLIFCRRGLHG